jgi:hypothetical protein
MEPQSESDLKKLHKFLSSRNKISSRYWIVSYCSFCAFIGLLFGLLIGAEYVQRSNLNSKVLSGIGIVKANSEEYYKMERLRNDNK